MGAALDQGSATRAAGGGSGHKQCSGSGSVRLGKPGIGTADAGPTVEARTGVAVAVRVKVTVTQVRQQRHRWQRQSGQNQGSVSVAAMAMLGGCGFGYWRLRVLEGIGMKGFDHLPPLFINQWSN